MTRQIAPTKGDTVSARNTPKIDFKFALRKLEKCLYVYIGETEHSGFGIFAARHFKAGIIIIADEDGDYYDNAMSYDEVIQNGYDIVQDCIQVGPDLYNLPNGNLDDIMNHSCDPNYRPSSDARGLSDRCAARHRAGRRTDLRLLDLHQRQAREPPLPLRHAEMPGHDRQLRRPARGVRRRYLDLSVSALSLADAGPEPTASSA